jgi:hypothetical protein
MQMWSVSAEALPSAGTVVNNTATAPYLIRGSPASKSASADFQVQEVIDVAVAWTDGTNVIVTTPDTVGEVASFDISTTGNGSETFFLAVDNASPVTDDFQFILPADVEVFIENGVTPGFQVGQDTPYIAGVNDPIIAGESTQTVYLRSKIQGGLTDGDEGHLTVTATSLTVFDNAAPGSLAGTSLGGFGDGGVDAIMGSSLGVASANAIYQVSSVDVTLDKIILLAVDPYGGSTYVPGTEVTYQITVGVTGGTAQALAISDPIPANTTYKDDTLFLNGGILTEESDVDAGDFNISQPGAITVILGNTVGGGAANIILLTVTID